MYAIFPSSWEEDCLVVCTLSDASGFCWCACGQWQLQHISALVNTNMMSSHLHVCIQYWLELCTM